METQMHVCAAKAGVDMITRVGALEWGAAGVRVNSVLPGPIEDTEGMARLAPTPEPKQATIDSVPMQRYGSKQDIANRSEERRGGKECVSTCRSRGARCT